MHYVEGGGFALRILFLIAVSATLALVNAPRALAASSSSSSGDNLWFYPILLLCFLIAFGFMLIYDYVQKKRDRRSFTETLEGKYWREPIDSLHPAEMYLLTVKADLSTRPRLHSGRVEPLSATILHLIQHGAIRVEDTGSSYRLVRIPEQAQNLDNPADLAAMKFLFARVGLTSDAQFQADYERYHESMKLWRKARRQVELGLATAEEREFANKKPEVEDLFAPIRYVDSMNISDMFYAEREFSHRYWTWIEEWAAIKNPLRDSLIGISPDARGIIRSRLWGLTNWLNDFPSLGEKVSRDAGFWNQMLCIAVATGVAEQAMANIGQSVPNVLFHSDFAATFSWCGKKKPARDAAMTAFSEAFSKAYTRAYNTEYPAF